MAVWIIPVLKAVLPHLGTILKAAGPIFTKLKGDETAVQSSFLQQQITELQTAAAQNDANIKKLAEQLQIALGALQQGATVEVKAERRLYRLCFTAVVISIVSVVISLFALFGA